MLKCGNECPFLSRSSMCRSRPYSLRGKAVSRHTANFPSSEPKCPAASHKSPCGRTRNFHSKRNIQLISAVPEISYCINLEVGDKRLDSN